jgi:hypothetical protein
MKPIKFEAINWNQIPKIAAPGENGTSYTQTKHFNGLRLRIVEYTAGYYADHWCQIGHIVQCLSGEFVSEQADGTLFTLKKGMSYVVTDDMSSHRSFAKVPTKLFIIDGAFLNTKRIKEEK